VEAAWLHHRFVRIHPFQDGNGRMARLLMAYVFARAGEFPPVISMMQRNDYIRNLEWADGGDLRRFVQYLADLAATTTLSALSIAEDVLDGRNWRTHGNGGQTVRESDGQWRYLPPVS